MKKLIQVSISFLFLVTLSLSLNSCTKEDLNNEDNLLTHPKTSETRPLTGFYSKTNSTESSDVGNRQSMRSSGYSEASGEY